MWNGSLGTQVDFFFPLGGKEKNHNTLKSVLVTSSWVPCIVGLVRQTAPQAVVLWVPLQREGFSHQKSFWTVITIAISGGKKSEGEEEEKEEDKGESKSKENTAWWPLRWKLWVENPQVAFWDRSQHIHLTSMLLLAADNNFLKITAGNLYWKKKNDRKMAESKMQGREHRSLHQWALGLGTSCGIY